MCCALIATALLNVQPVSAGLGKEAIEASGVRGGVIVSLSAGDPAMLVEMAKAGPFLVQGLDADSGKVAAARITIGKERVYGTVSVDVFDGKRLPYADGLVNLVVSSADSTVSREEIMRVLAPGGVSLDLSDQTDLSDQRFVKSVPPEIDDWTHYLHSAGNNAVAKDDVVGPPARMQWVSAPLYARSHEIDSTMPALVSDGGRVFYIVDEGITGITDPRLPQRWALIARDAFNGVQLWRRVLPDWGWPQWKPEWGAQDWTSTRGQRTRSPVTVPRRLVAGGSHVYVTLGFNAPLSALDAATGEIVRTYGGTERTEEVLHAGGVLVLSVSEAAKPVQSTARNTEKKGGKKNKGKGGKTSLVKSAVMAVDAATGRTLWRTPPGRVLPMTLAVHAGRVFYHAGDSVVALSLKNGKEQWRTPNKTARSSAWGANHTMLAADGVVLICVPGRTEAFSGETGEKLWSDKGGQRGCSNPPDLFVADGLVWNSYQGNGRDPKTGEVKRKVEMPGCLITPGHHIRCYRGKATDRYVMSTKRGVEFMDIGGGDNHMKCDWLRASCKYGFMPANGLLYMTPHQCFCYAGAKLCGLNALAPKAPGSDARAGGTRLEKGPAYGGISDVKSQISNAADWPTFRHDPKRLGSAASRVPAKPEQQWETKLAGPSSSDDFAVPSKLSQPVVADGRLYVASVDSHTVHALEASSGKPVWHFTAGGRIDSPPTVYAGLVLFGSADGWVYCLRDADGELVWRFRAAPVERHVVAFGQLESAWPVAGSVLVLDGVAYAAAGRSSYLDGGIFVYGLETATGKVLHRGRVEGPYPDVHETVGAPFDMPGAFADVLVTDGEHLFVQQVVLDKQLREVEAPRLTNMGDRKFGRHVFTTAGFLNDACWNRTFWMYGERFPGFYIANQSPRAGQMLVVDDATTYAIKYFTRRNRHSPMYFPATDGYLLFADDNDNEPLLYDGKEPKPVKWLPDVNKAIGWGLTTPAVNKDKGTGFTRSKPPKWQTWVPVRVQAMVKTPEALFIAGVPDVLDEDDPYASFEGRKGGLLWAVSPTDGKKLLETKLEASPAWDGLIAAQGRLYMTTRDGRVVCMGKK